MKKITLITFFLLLTACTNDKTSVINVAETYAISWQKGNDEAMASTLHERLIKRAILPLENPSPPKDQIFAWYNENVYLHSQGKKNLVEKTKNNKNNTSKIKTPKISILEISKKTAMVKLKSKHWTDYLQMAKIDNEWKIINVLWETH